MSVIGRKSNRAARVAATLSAMFIGLGAGLIGTAAHAHYIGNYIQVGDPHDLFPEENGGCHNGYFCAWPDTGAWGKGAGWYNTDWNWNDPSRPSYIRFLNDNAESWWNNSSAGNDVQVYQTAGGYGSITCVQTGAYHSVAASRNTASAHVFRKSC